MNEESNSKKEEEFDVELERIKQKKLQELLASKEIIKEEQKKPWPQEPIEITDANLQQLIQKYPLIVIDCWAPWCGPCFMIAPVIEELAKVYAGKIVFGKLNVDENQRTAMSYGIMSIPCLLIFKNGRLADQVIGAMPRQMLEPKITKHL